MKKRVNKIYLFRHGQTTFNRDKRFTGHLDSRLTKEGIKHAKHIALKMKNKRFQVAIHTSLSRSIETLKPVLKYHPECKLVLQDDRIIERDYGRLCGHYHKEIIEKYGKDKFDEWHRGYNNRPPRGESFRDVEKRVKKFLIYLKKFVKKNKVNVAISAHGNSIRLFRKIMEKASINEAVSWNIPYDKVFTYEI